MTISSLPLLDITGTDADWPDEVVDLTDRRRLLLQAVLGVDVPPRQADAVFDPERLDATA
ncbi:MAG TPA: hypothetical protein VFV42_05025 [Acidimicrobiales bacterium]|nr:hypothetical protein [Acidimicrobiales bacterium]